jgi:hypothetical protein
MYSNEADSFAKFPAYAKRFQAADLENYYQIQVHKETGHFLRAFFALASLRHAYKSLRKLIRIDSTYTASQFRINLFITGRTDANNKTLLLA